MITINRADLDFLLRQVTINYLATDPLNPGQFIPTTVFNYSALANAVDPSGLREVSGANNNLVGGYWDANTQTWVPGPNTTWGQANQPFLNQSVGQSVTSAPQSAYSTPGGAVADADPRLISNLVATMFTTGPHANPAAADAATNGDPDAVFGGLQVNGADTAFMANAGVLGGGRYNGWFVAFGQFFDHGLDFVVRDPDTTATVTINLSPNDPLYFNDGPGGQPDVTSITVRRADVANPGDAGGDGIFGTTDDNGYSAGADGVAGNADDTYAKAKYINNTGLLIDQSQTYGSHQSVNALIREYDANGRPTGRVVAGNTEDGPNLSSGLATWADIKVNALRIGVILDPDPSPFTNVDLNNAPMLRVDPTGKLMYTPDSTDLYTTAQIVGFDPLNQDPNDPFVRDAAGNVLRTGQDMLIDFNPGQSLDAHIITGDGRANENIGLTAVHHVFHEEHNALVGNIQGSIVAEYTAILSDPGPNGGLAAALAFIAPWQSSPGVWDGEKLYQAARLVTESEYNHIAIDQYVGTLYGALPEFVSYSSDINMGVSLEFSQAVFRLGHSMLTETFNVDVLDDPLNPGGPTHKLTLLEAFVNPELYADLGPQTLALGLTTTLGNEVDEFVTPALQQSLLGQPLDLATINIARGRDVGLPTWNEFRQQVYDQLIQNTNNTNGSALAPYTNWADVGDHLKNTGTLVNMIAAYARGDGDSTNGDHPLTDAIVQARIDYNNGDATIADLRATAQALYDAYLNVPGTTVADHAEAIAFMQGAPTYNPGTGQWTFAGADQGFWDIDLWIGGLAERPLFDGPLGTTFSYVILDFAQRQQDGDRFYYLFRTPMGTHLGNEIIENQFGNLVMDHTGLDHLNGEIFIWANETYTLTDSPDYFNVANETILDVDGTPMPASAGHLIISGLGGDDYLVAGLGDDTVYGDAGNDQIYGSQGNDHLFGGDGNDYILDDENDDFITGGGGNDRIFAGPGAIDTVFGDEGDDEIHGGDGIDELLGGTGDDMIYGDGDTDVLFGEEGNDYLEGGDSVDEMQGQEGNDWMRGGVGDDHLMGGDGNDLLEGGVGPTANDGDRMLGQGVLDFALTNPPDLGFDVVSYEDVDIAITANLDTSNENGTGGLLDTYAGVEGLVGTRFNDNLTGADTDTTTSNGFDNLLVGGAGNDILTGLGGDDFIAGDSVVVKNDLSVYLGPASYTTITNWKGTGENRPDFGVSGGLGHFLGDNGTNGTSDRAVFSGARTDYSITQNADGTLRVVDNRGIDSTAAGDTVKDVEFFQFSNGTFAVADLINFAATGAPVISDLTPTEGQVLTVNTTSIADANGLGAFSYQWQALIGATWTNIAGATGASFTPDDNPLQSFGDQAGQQLRVRVSFTDADGYAESITSAPTGPVGVNWSGLISFGATFNGTAGDDIASGSLLGDTLNGNAGNDSLDGLTGNDTITGGTGNDVVTGGGGTDVAVYAGAAGNFSFEVSGTTGILVTDTIGTEGIDTLSGIETLRFNGVNYAVVPGTTGNNPNLNGAAGAAGSQAVFGFAGTDSINGGAGNDIIHGGDGTDTIAQTGATGGRDSVNGGGGIDTYVLNGAAGAETFRIYTRAAAIAAGMTIVNTNTEIVVTRNGTTNAAIITELDNVEEITVNTLNVTTPGGAGGGAAGDDTVIVIGDFTGTSLNFNTITINGGNGNDTVDITGLTSDHRIVFHGGGGHNQVIGDLRPQDVVDGGTPSTPPGDDPPGDTPAINPSPVMPPYVGADALLGTPEDDVLIGGAGDDVVSGVGGDDLILGNDGADTLKGGDGDDLIKGGGGDDIAFGNAGNDDVFGGAGQDMLFGDQGNDRLFGDDGNDIVEGGTGNDTVYAGSGDDRILATVNDGDDLYWGEDGRDTVDYSAFTADVKVDLGNGLVQHGSVVSAQGGNDAIFGFENFIGGSGKDTIVASAAVNVMDGGPGNDTLVFKSAADANNDVIKGFQPGDRIDLSGVDANTASSGNQSFVLFAGTGFTAAGQIIMTHEIQDGVDHTIVAGNVNNDTVADFKIDIVGNHALTPSDFHGVN